MTILTIFVAARRYASAVYATILSLRLVIGYKSVFYQNGKQRRIHNI